VRLSNIARWLALAAAVYFLFLFGLDGVGLLGPDEPRYAAIGQEMARSGDWVTPRLWGEPWFEKPPLLYWMSAAGFAAGFGPETAPRLPVALLSIAFLVFYWRALEREFGRRAALFSTAVLGTSAAWLAFSHVAVMDLPMAAAFSAAMLLCLPWLERGDRRALPAAAALVGVAVLAKGLPPLALALPVAWMGRRRWRDWLRPAPIAAFLIVVLPWYALITARFGEAFLADFFLKHHFARFFTGALEHRQPFWFYIPVLLAGLFPWTPLLVLLRGRALYSDVRLRFLLAWAAFGFVFFSASTNKLPGYLLPLIPAVCALVGVALAKRERAIAPLAVCGALLALVPVVVAVLPEALRRGITHVDPPEAWRWLACLPALLIAPGVAWIERRGQRAFAITAVAAATVAGVVWLESAAFPALDRTVSARGFWRQVAPRASELCVGNVNRGWRYNLNYYSGTPLPECAGAPRPLRIEPAATLSATSPPGRE
jgi:4-amino-4-deoxy-L-arabinose transferase-like glycosyltransferase